ncbi:MAG: cobalt ECF transporter T component CbiQ, partial [Deltaproteobacteria bacterium]|nr:cobalt ECF transporter T component CbiQ [Deltaproteobacteria bacterium]
MQEPFATGQSQIHHLDPRLKVLFATVYSFVVALSDRFPSLFVALALSFLLIGLARLNIREVAKRVLIVNGLILLFWLVLPLTFEGEALFYLGPFAVTREGLLISAMITLKSNAILLAFIALIASTSIATLGYALNRLRIPEKIVHLLLLTYRYVFVIEQEYQRLVRAAKI